jgi:hypothetical protein
MYRVPENNIRALRPLRPLRIVLGAKATRRYRRPGAWRLTQRGRDDQPKAR